jgi:hypothetical protein
MSAQRQVACTGSRADSGQASVELVAVLPALLLAALLAAQIAVTGFALWSAAVSARAGARAAAIGGDATPAARRALPDGLRRGSRVSGADRVSVHVPVPRLVPGLPHFAVSATSRLSPEVGNG